MRKQDLVGDVSYLTHTSRYFWCQSSCSDFSSIHWGAGGLWERGGLLERTGAVSGWEAGASGATWGCWRKWSPVLWEGALSISPPQQGGRTLEEQSCACRCRGTGGCPVLWGRAVLGGWRLWHTVEMWKATGSPEFTCVTR